MFTQVRSANRRVSPVENHKHKAVMKAVYVVLEPQYQNALTQAAKSLNSQNGPIGIELNGYLIEELRDTTCLLYTSPSPRDQRGSRMPSSA